MLETLRLVPRRNAGLKLHRRGPVVVRVGEVGEGNLAPAFMRQRQLRQVGTGGSHDVEREDIVVSVGRTQRESSLESAQLIQRKQPGSLAELLRSAEPSPLPVSHEQRVEAVLRLPPASTRSKISSLMMSTSLDRTSGCMIDSGSMGCLLAKMLQTSLSDVGYDLKCVRMNSPAKPVMSGLGDRHRSLEIPSARHASHLEDVGGKSVLEADGVGDCDDLHGVLA